MTCGLSRSKWVTDTSSSAGDGKALVVLKANSGQSNDPIAFTSEARIIHSGG